MISIENNKYHLLSTGTTEPLLSTDGVHSQPVTSRRWFKVGMVPIALIGGSCLMFALMEATTSSSPTIDRTGAAGSTNLAALSPVSRFRSAGAVKPGITNHMRAPVLSGSSPFQKMAISRDYKVRHGGGWDNVPEEIVAEEARRILDSREIVIPNLDGTVERQVPAKSELGAGDIFKILGGMFAVTGTLIGIISVTSH